VKKTILCVDDEHSLSIHKLTLQTWGYRVLACRTAAEALQNLEKGGVDLVLSSLELPDISAIELPRLFRTAAQTPLIILSSSKRACPIDDRNVELLQKGSYAQAELLGRIRQLLSKRRGRRAASAASFTAAGTC
jgi:DNA-binding response OmpR family regulator